MKKQELNELNELMNTAEFKDYLQDLAYFSGIYVEDVKKLMAKNAIVNFENKTIVKLLHEYRYRSVKEEADLLRVFDYNVRSLNEDDGEEISFSNNCLTNSSHYRTVLYDLLIREEER